MAHFQRGLPKHALETTGRLVSSSSWMRDLLAEWAPSGTPGSLRLAVRNGYLNFYHFGQSVSKVEFPEKTATATVHHKYVIRKAGGQTYLKIGAAEGLDDTGKRCEWGGSPMLASWIARAACYADPEKRQIGALLDRSPNVIDLEIALPARQKGDSAPRMDIAALDDPSDGSPARVVFWEVKRINDARLRSRTVPRVVKQIEAYERYVRGDRPHFVNAYGETCRVLCEFHRVASSLREAPRLDSLISAAADGQRLEVDVEPRLLIVEDEAPKRNWDYHLRKLTDWIGDRVHLVRPGQTVPRVLRAA